MSQFKTEIRLFAFPFAPTGWMKCNGQALSVQNSADLFSLLGYRYGGSGDTFNLPDLRGRVLMHNAQDRPPFLRAGVAEHRLTIKEMPKHNHYAVASSQGVNRNTPADHFWASDVGYVKDPNNLMHEDTIGIAGGDMAHDNMSPYLPLNYCIAVDGLYPNVDYREVEEFTGGIRPFVKPVEEGVWLKCDGRELPIASFTELYAVIRNTYGGVDGRTFRLPDLRGRSLVGAGTPAELTHYKLGETAGEVTVALIKAQMPGHSHRALASATAMSQQPSKCGWGNYSGKRPAPDCFASVKGDGAIMSAKAFGETGGDEAHNNMMPYQGMDYMICTRRV